MDETLREFAVSVWNAYIAYNLTELQLQYSTCELQLYSSDRGLGKPLVFSVYKLTSSAEVI